MTRNRLAGGARIAAEPAQVRGMCADKTTRTPPAMGDLKPTSRKRKPAAVKEEASRLHSRIVRLTKGPWCQDGCGRLATDAAHIVGRSYSHTRTDVDNALALAAECHRHYTNWPADWLEFIDRIIGRDEYDRLCQKARDGVNVKMDWYAELDRLKAIWVGLDDHERVTE